jgi:hypothetical protein
MLYAKPVLVGVRYLRLNLSISYVNSPIAKMPKCGYNITEGYKSELPGNLIALFSVGS